MKQGLTFILVLISRLVFVDSTLLTPFIESVSFVWVRIDVWPFLLSAVEVLFYCCSHVSILSVCIFIVDIVNMGNVLDVVKSKTDNSDEEDLEYMCTQNSAIFNDGFLGEIFESLPEFEGTVIADVGYCL